METAQTTTVYGRTSENWYKEILPYETKIKFKLSTTDEEKYGTIVGISSEGVTVSGRQYIVKLDDKSMYDEKLYNYPCVAVWEIYLEVVN